MGKFEQLEFKETSNLVTIYRNILESMADPEHFQYRWRLH